MGNAGNKSEKLLAVPAKLFPSVWGIQIEGFGQGILRDGQNVFFFANLEAFP